MDSFWAEFGSLAEAEYWMLVAEVLAEEHRGRGREIDRQIAKLQRENAELFKKSRELRNARLVTAPWVKVREPELWGFIHWMRRLREWADHH